ncbi:hypothetical protein AB0F72_08720 [Actinoplanes sp. NPDC023936]|uniref:hypothetical protein n=1 Tax=Actinoplanes sp. NPDC023936 TaxID=3154910 RepID=UPI0033DF50EE
MTFDETWQHVAKDPDLARLVLMVDDPDRGTCVCWRKGSEPLEFFTPQTSLAGGLPDDDAELLRQLIDWGVISHPQTRRGNQLALSELGEHARSVILDRR